MRLIDADALLHTLSIYCKGRDIPKETVSDIRSILRNYPTVEPNTVLLVARDEWVDIKRRIMDGNISTIMIGDVAFRKGEVEKHGHWIDKPLPLWESVNGTKGECSVCHETDLFYSKYCPNCGAKMDEVEDE